MRCGVLARGALLYLGRHQARIQVLELEGAKFGEGSGDRLGPQSGPGRSPGGGTRWAKPPGSSSN